MRMRYKPQLLQATKRWMMLLMLVLISPAAFALPFTIDLSNADATTILSNIAEQLPWLMRLITAIAYVLGMYFIIAALMYLKKFGEMRTQMSHEHTLAKPITYFVIGTLLIYLPTAIQIGMGSFWTNPNPYGYLQVTDQWSSFYKICFMVVQLVGVIAFIKGLLMLARVGGHGRSDELSKAITHIIGGILCINIFQFVQLIINTLGIGG